MRKMLLLIALSTACADSAETPSHDLVPAATVDEGPDVTAASPLRAAVDNDTQPNLCNLLPDDDSACAHACDPAAFADAIPEGTCAVFDCPLSDGTIYRTGGCNTP